MQTLNKPQPIKTIRDRRLAYLIALVDSYKEMGYVTRLDGKLNLLEVYKAGTVFPEPQAADPDLDKWAFQ